jgi:ABC-type multidrug transport system ATPase subunit
VSLLKEIRFELDRGSILALLGPNGAGKSTLLKCIAGLQPHLGSKEILGQQLARNYPLKSRIGYLAHETFLYPKLTAAENLLFYGNLYGLQVDPTTVLREYGIESAAHQFVETFSRGMKQRLALARTLMPRPDLLLLDEPFTGLDDQAQTFLSERIARLHGKVTIILTTHELDRAYRLCDHLLILKNGRQAFFGHKDQVTTDIHEFYRTVTGT